MWMASWTANATCVRFYSLWLPQHSSRLGLRLCSWTIMLPHIVVEPWTHLWCKLASPGCHGRQTARTSTPLRTSGVSLGGEFKKTTLCQQIDNSCCTTCSRSGQTSPRPSLQEQSTPWGSAVWIVWQHEGDTFGFDQTVKKKTHSFLWMSFLGGALIQAPRSNEKD